ncbi:MAG TPA: Rne/Rng family ribonuclease, partial [Candidatus Saccharimonadales bacterium]|nr:Rne/Rng family ribonuclease [Candidatus Saccharimonadales bacterium]
RRPQGGRRSRRPAARGGGPEKAAAAEEEPILLEAIEAEGDGPPLELLAELEAEAEPPLPVEVEAEIEEPASRRTARRRRRTGVDRMIVVSTTSKEVRVAILESGVVAELFIERSLAPTVVGNIYKGRVTKVLPGMQAAFVDIGLERDAFLYVSDIASGFDGYEGPLDLEEVEGGEEIRRSAPKADRRKPIQELVKQGQEIVVQVTKEGIGQKGARITSYVTIAGRFLVLMPQVDHVGVSRKIGDARERSRLRRVVENCRKHGLGFVVRTVARGATKPEVEGDVQYLTEQWVKARAKSDKSNAPARVHAEPGPFWRVLRDYFNQDVTKVIVDTPGAKAEAVEFIGRYDPDAVSKVELYTDTVPIMDRYGVQSELDKALRSRVWLKSGGYIVINQTEALVAIDVNTGKFVGKKNLEDTVLKTNLEAVTEIVRQLRLRDLGGIIVADFIDMESRRNRRKLTEAFEKELQKDRARTKVLQVSDFGLIELTRQRTKKSLERLLTRTCPYCSGAGKIKSNPTMLFEVQREIQRLAPSLEGQRLVVRANPEVAAEMEADRAVILEGLPSPNGTVLEIRADAEMHHEQYDIMSMPAARDTDKAPYGVTRRVQQ